MEKTAPRIPHILVTGCDTDYRGNVTEYVRMLGFEASEAGSAPEALEAILKGVPDLVVAEMDLGRLTAIEFAQGCRKTAEISPHNLPFIVLYARILPEDALLAGRAGIACLIPKTARLEALEQALHSFFPGHTRPISRKPH